MNMTVHASGTFEVKLAPLDPADAAAGVTLARMSIDKQFYGDLLGTSSGQMLSALAAEPGCGGYVAMERVTAVLKGRQGSFVLQHSGSMSAGSQQLHVDVVPGSGSGELSGLSGQMTIVMRDGRHHYDFLYQLPEPS